MVGEAISAVMRKEPRHPGTLPPRGLCTRSDPGTQSTTL